MKKTEGDKKKGGAWIREGVSADKSLERLADKVGRPIELAPTKPRGK